MERRKFLKSCCIAGAGIPIAAAILSSCEPLYYAQATTKSNTVIVPLTEFYYEVKGQRKKRKFILVNSEKGKFSICIYNLKKEGKDSYLASLLKCTHQGCSLNVGGGVYTCPCHGAEFSTSGQVLEGPAQTNLTTYKTTIENENIIVHLS